MWIRQKDNELPYVLSLIRRSYFIMQGKSMHMQELWGWFLSSAFHRLSEFPHDTAVINARIRKYKRLCVKFNYTGTNSASKTSKSIQKNRWTERSSATMEMKLCETSKRRRLATHQRALETMKCPFLLNFRCLLCVLFMFNSSLLSHSSVETYVKSLHLSNGSAGIRPSLSFDLSLC